MRRLVPVVLLLCAPGAGYCSSAGAGTVSRFTSEPGGIVVFEQSGARTALPTCADPSLGRRWALNVGDAAGAATFDLLMTAEALGTPVLLVGGDGCPSGVAIETLTGVSSAQ